MYFVRNTCHSLSVPLVRGSSLFTADSHVASLPSFAVANSKHSSESESEGAESSLRLEARYESLTNAGGNPESEFLDNPSSHSRSIWLMLAAKGLEVPELNGLLSRARRTSSYTSRLATLCRTRLRCRLLILLVVDILVIAKQLTL